MSLIKQPKIPTTPTKDQLLIVKARNIKSIAAKTYEQLVKIQQEGIDMFWNDPRLTPQEIADELGEDATKTFQFHGFLTDCIVNIATSDGILPEIKLPTNAFEVVDGNITILDSPYIPQ